MAGSGKTTFLQRLNAHLHARQQPGYIINLDPAVTHVPYGANVDIRDTVNYKNVRAPPPCCRSALQLLGCCGRRQGCRNGAAAGD